MKAKKLLPTALLSAVLLTSCSAPAQQDTSAQAILDRENNVIIKPIAEYEYSNYTSGLYNRIVEQMYTQCLAHKGITFTPGKELTPIGSREYGFWNPDYIDKYGYGIFENFSEETQLTSEEQKEFEACGKSEEIQSHYKRSLEVSEKTQIASDILTEARGHALKNPAWQEARKQWWSCLEDKGLTPRTGEDDWGSKQELEVDTSTQAGKEEKVRLALIEANCSQETGMAQTLADLEASYQMPLIQKHQADLNEAKKAIKDYTAELENHHYNTQ